MNQNTIFTECEGDAWFHRNQMHIQTIDQVIKLPDVKYVLDTLASFHARIERVLEIGSSNGIKLEAICQYFNSVGIGVEPSPMAVQHGNERKKKTKIELLVGTGENLPFEDSSFDLVYFTFCLYLFDRKRLMQSLAEADRVLKPGGFLIITDFDPGFRHQKPYSHFQGVFSYKQDYTSFFTQTGLYYHLGKSSYSHRSANFDEEPGERVATNILYKEVDPYPLHR
jgi:ubiquinone/menaquinone biosynthesis C-methylase UbiE